jgi:predicted aminopeptidase
VNGLKYIAIGFIALFLSSCIDVPYYFHSSWGHAKIMMKRQSITGLIESPDTPDEMKNKLRSVLLMQRFAVDDLYLPDAGSYLELVQLESPYVAWNVYLTPEFSLTPHTWCFPLIGCVSYRGYFSEEKAKKFSATYRLKGFDVYVGPVLAYSTLGWFKDPLFSPLLQWPEERLAGLIFHELAHARLYIKNDTTFNESFAAVVEREGVKRWLKKRGLTDRIKSDSEERITREPFLKVVSSARQKLGALYRSSVDDREKRLRKIEIFKEMLTLYREIKGGEDATDSREEWLATDMNNAKLASVTIYNDYVPAFENLLLIVDGDMELFYKEAAKIGALPKKDRAVQMKLLADESALYKLSVSMNEN